MKCKHCGKETPDEEVARYLASKGGTKNKRTITPEQQERLQIARAAKRSRNKHTNPGEPGTEP